MHPTTDPPSARWGFARLIGLFLLATLVLAAAWLPVAASPDRGTPPLEVPTAVADQGPSPAVADGYRRVGVVRWLLQRIPAAVLAVAALVIVHARGRFDLTALRAAPAVSGWQPAWVNRGPPPLLV